MSKKEIAEAMLQLFDPSTVDSLIDSEWRGIEHAEGIKAVAKEKIKDRKLRQQVIKDCDKSIKFYEKGIKKLERLRKKKIKNRDELRRIIDTMSPGSKKSGSKKRATKAEKQTATKRSRKNKVA